MPYIKHGVPPYTHTHTHTHTYSTSLLRPNIVESTIHIHPSN